MGASSYRILHAGRIAYRQVFTEEAVSLERIGDYIAQIGLWKTIHRNIPLILWVRFCLLSFYWIIMATTFL